MHQKAKKGNKPSNKPSPTPPHHAYGLGKHGLVPHTASALGHEHGSVVSPLSAAEATKAYHWRAGNVDLATGAGQQRHDGPVTGQAPVRDPSGVAERDQGRQPPGRRPWLRLTRFSIQSPWSEPEKTQTVKRSIATDGGAVAFVCLGSILRVCVSLLVAAAAIEAGSGCHRRRGGTTRRRSHRR